MDYKGKIEEYAPITLDDIINVSSELVPDRYRYAPWTCPGLEHGTAQLESDDQLNCYIAAYGQMHKGKLDCAISQFPFNQIDKNYEIIDWGCGQGIASVRMIESLRNKGIGDMLQKVTLIEPSACALERAKLNVKLSTDEDVYIETLNCFLSVTNSGNIAGEPLGGLHVEEQICIHLFSNILDIPTIDLKELAYMVGSSGYRHYFICVGPVYFGNERIVSFLKYFELSANDIFVDVKAAQYRQLQNGKWYGCLAKGFQIVREDGKPFLVSLSYYPPKQFFAAYRLDVIEEIDKINASSVGYWAQKSAFEVLAPFDFGASIYEDIDPILAVISNLITRGLPTKCSPFIEEKINDEYRISRKEIKYGTIRFINDNNKSFEENERILREIPIGVARLEKVIIEAVLTGRISIDKEEWNVLVKENDIPCAALAFEELKMMFNNLCKMSSAYQHRQFPKVTLHIISPLYADSSLHLGNRIYKSIKQVNREIEYDMVIDFAVNQNVDAANVQFSEFKAGNNCYFNVRSSKYQYASRDIYTSDRIVYLQIVEKQENGETLINDSNVGHLIYFLQLLFRKEGFRPGQIPILNRALQNKSVIGLLPTGGGKSLTYQLVAMLQPGITVVIDPLKSLMEDQYDGLRAIGIDCCTYINSELSKEERELHEQMMESSQVIFTFMSPERLCIYEFRERLKNMHELNIYFSYGVIDEVHCVSEWGQDFRFSYLHLGRNLYSYVRSKNGAISLFGLTATASFDVLSDVERELTGNGSFVLDPEIVVRYENSNRLELQYKIEKIEVEYKDDPYYDKSGVLEGYPRAVNIGDNWGAYEQKSKFLVQYIKRIPQYIQELQTEDAINRIFARFQERESLENFEAEKLLVPMPDDYYKKKQEYQEAGIVFCPHVNSSGISVNVNSRNLSGLCEVGTFAGSAQEGDTQGNESIRFMRKFRCNELPLMVATKAFGMGIDKPNVRFTINMNYSSSLESFVQEAGRAGRDRKMALSVILMSDYHLARINVKCPFVGEPYSIIKGKWFKENDLRFILDSFGLSVDERYIDVCNPLSDIVRLKCRTDNKDENDKPLTWRCEPACSKYSLCELRHVDKKKRGWQFHRDLNEYLNLNRIRIPKDCIEYQGADYSTVMYFFDNNFKGEFEEKKKMYYLLSEMELSYFIGNDKKDKPEAYEMARGFLEIVLHSPIGTEVVALIPYENDSHADIAKAIYRMCVIGLIDDFTQDYGKRAFRILLTRKTNGSYYEHLKQYLMRYYSEERAENEVEKASVRKGKNEIHKCLGYLTEFIYDKVALKRKRAIDDMRNFCLTGIDDSKDWKEINEDLKDEIYFYFNSKYAREGYKTENDEPFSLLDDSDRGKISSFDILFKYMRVVDNDVIGVSGSPKDNIKHLQGAVRLIRRSETETNAALCLLNVYCLLVLKVGSNAAMKEELDKSYMQGYRTFKKDAKDIDLFYNNIDLFKELLNRNGRNIVSEDDLKYLSDLEIQAELSDHFEWTEKFVNQYNN